MEMHCLIKKILKQIGLEGFSNFTMENLLRNLAKNVILKDFTSYKNINEILPSVSDFLPYRTGDFNTSFILENVKAIYQSKKNKHDVELTFFDRNGKECLRKNFRFNSFDHSIEISKFKSKLDAFGGFYVSAKSSMNFTAKYRGYTGFSISHEEFFSYVHGNFGHLYRSASGHTRSLAKISKKLFCYSPQLTLNDRQDFFVLNPYEEKLNVTFYAKVNGELKFIDKKLIPAFGSYIFRNNLRNISGHLGLPVFESNSPSLRAIVFEKCPNGSFDILHS